MRFYVAGKFENIRTIRQVQEMLIATGHHISFDWTIYQIGTLSDQAKLDMEGVRVADVYIGVFLRNLSYRGALAELGAALALNKRVIIIGHGADRCLFTYHPTVERFERLCDFEGFVKQGGLNGKG